MNFMKIIILLVMVMDKVKTDHPPVPDLFANLDPKEAPLYICKASGNSIKWKLPSHLPCDPVDTTLSTSLVNITLWFEDTSSYTIPVGECYSEVTYTRITVNWNFEIVNATWTETSRMTKTACSKIIAMYESNRLHKLKTNLYGTKKTLQTPIKYMTCTTSSITNYYLMVLQATIENEKWTVETSSNLNKPCPFKWGSCKSRQGILAWDSDLKMCTLRKGISTTCFVTGSRISCVEYSLSLNIVDLVKRCGMIIGFTEEGIFYTQDNVFGKNGISLGTTPTPAVAEQIHGKGFEESSPVYNFDKFQFTYYLIEANSSIDIQSWHESICKSNQMWHDSIRMLVQLGTSTKSHFELLNGENEDKHLPNLDGRLLSIYKCVTIYKYQMLPREKNACIREWPIVYIYENVRKTGYMSGASHEIVDLPTKNDCSFLEFYFDSGKHLYLLNDNSVVKSMPFPGSIKPA